MLHQIEPFSLKRCFPLWPNSQLKEALLWENDRCLPHPYSLAHFGRKDRTCHLFPSCLYGVKRPFHASVSNAGRSLIYGWTAILFLVFFGETASRVCAPFPAQILCENKSIDLLNFGLLSWPGSLLSNTVGLKRLEGTPSLRVLLTVYGAGHAAVYSYPGIWSFWTLKWRLQKAWETYQNVSHYLGINGMAYEGRLRRPQKGTKRY